MTSDNALRDALWLTVQFFEPVWTPAEHARWLLLTATTEVSSLVLVSYINATLKNPK